MAKSNSHHVVHDPDGGWNVRRSGSSRISRHFDTKLQAVDVAREVSRNQGTELFIHGMNGRIQARDSHGNDPFPPKGYRSQGHRGRLGHYQVRTACPASIAPDRARRAYHAATNRPASIRGGGDDVFGAAEHQTGGDLR